MCSYLHLHNLKSHRTQSPISCLCRVLVKCQLATCCRWLPYREGQVGNPPFTVESSTGHDGQLQQHSDKITRGRTEKWTLISLCCFVNFWLLPECPLMGTRGWQTAKVTLFLGKILLLHGTLSRQDGTWNNSIYMVCSLETSFWKLTTPE